MKRLFQTCLLVAAIVFLTGCAQGYYPVNPGKIEFKATNYLADIQLSYRYDVLADRGNSKFSKKEKKNNVKLVAVKITNNTDSVINIGKNAAFYSGNNIIYPLDAIMTHKFIKQSVPSHLWYLLLTPLTLSINYSSPIPIGLALGPGIAGGNMLVANGANNKFYSDLQKFDILLSDIAPGETVYGLVGFKDLDYAPLAIKRIR